MAATLKGPTMPNEFKVWIETEEYDATNDEYTKDGDPEPIPSDGVTFETEADAINAKLMAVQLYRLAMSIDQKLLVRQMGVLAGINAQLQIVLEDDPKFRQEHQAIEGVLNLLGSIRDVLQPVPVE
jgi:hypothetical protein